MSGDTEPQHMATLPGLEAFHNSFDAGRHSGE